MCHAAAYKHVPLMEEGNAWEAIQNNVLGIWRVAKSRAAPDAQWMNEVLAWLQQGSPGTEQARRELAARVPEYIPQATSAAAIPERPAALQPS